MFSFCVLTNWDSTPGTSKNSVACYHECISHTGLQYQKCKLLWLFGMLTVSCQRTVRIEGHFFAIYTRSLGEEFALFVLNIPRNVEQID